MAKAKSETPAPEPVETPEVTTPAEVVETPVDPAPAAPAKPATTKRERDAINSYGVTKPQPPADDVVSETPETPVEGEADAVTPEAEAAAEAVAASVPGVTVEESANYVKELTDNGKLSDESYAALAEKGYPKDIVDTYLRGQSTADPAIEGFYSEFGGKDAYLTKVIPWAQANLDDAAIASFDAILSQNDWPKARDAAAKLYAEYVKDQGQPAGFKVIGHPTDAPGGLAPFKSAIELRKALASPEYKQSHSFREEVSQRAAVSRQMGINLQ